MLKRVLRRSRTIALQTEIIIAAHGWHVRSGLRMPDFIGIGSPVSASTWLADNLNRHPDVSISRNKETKFFSHHLDHGLGWYSKQFTAEDGKIVGEFTPSYSKLRLERIKLIHKLMPNARLIMIIRNPIDRAWGAARRTMNIMIRKNWGGSLEQVPKEEFLSFFSLESDYKPEVLDRKGAYEPDIKSSNYCQILDNWLKFFSEEQILIIFYDDIKNDPANVLQRAFSHIGANTEIDFSLFSLSPINSNPQLSMPEWARNKLEELYREEINCMKKRFGTELPNWD